MKLRYYLRGLGIGIIVTAVLMGIAGSRKQNMSDEEIKARAAELGMIESTTLADASNHEDSSGHESAVTPEVTKTPTTAVTPETADTPEAEAEPEMTQEPTEEAIPETTDMPTTAVTPNATDTPAATTPEAARVPTTTAVPEATQTPAATPTPEPTQTPTAAPTPEVTQVPEETGETVIIVIRSGESSVSVSRSVAEAGLVESASDFDQYLCGNGYDKKLTVGSHAVPVDATYEEIARILTTRN